MTRSQLPYGIVAIAIVLTLPASLAAAAPAKEETCTTAVSAPICVAKTWFGCQVFNPRLCDLIGVPRGAFVASDKDRLGRAPMAARETPWRLTYEELQAASNKLEGDYYDESIRYFGT